MDSDLIILDDELHLLADLAQAEQFQQQPHTHHQQFYPVNPGPSRTRRATRAAPQAVAPPPPPPPQRRPHRQPVSTPAPTPSGRGVKRTRNGARVMPATVSAPNPAMFNSQSVIVDGQDVYYIEEVDDNDSSSAVATTEQVPYLNPSAIIAYAADEESNVITGDATEEGQPLSEEQDYYNVEPLELSDIWNDLITANQEILILLELSDLKAHIVDARRIEEQIRDMTCEYCNATFPDIKTLDRHIKKIHFHTELFECDSCDGKFRHFARFKDHLNGHTGDRVYLCDECNHQYAFRMGFLVHKILDHMKLNGVYVCPKCDLDCRDAQNYKLHIASHIEFGPSQMNTPAAQLPAAQPVVAAAATSTAARHSNGTTVRKPPVFAKENERNKFLNVFESFSKNRNVEKPLPTGGSRYKKN